MVATHQTKSSNGNITQVHPDVAEHQKRQEEAQNLRLRRVRQKEERAVKQDAASFDYLSAPRSIEDFTIAVECPLPVYKGMVVHFRTNNPTKTRRAVPDDTEPPELIAARARLHVAEPLTEKGEPNPRYQEAQAEVKRLNAEYEADYKRRSAEWLAVFVKRFTPWNIESFPAPDPRNPETYLPLYEECEDLVTWCISKGYHEALERSLGNSGGR
jgi:hypothetical protein